MLSYTCAVSDVRAEQQREEMNMKQASTLSASNTEKMMGKEQIRKLTLAAMLTAIVVVLQLLAKAIPVGTFSINLALVPIVIGAALLGIWYGAWLGLVNAIVILLSGDAAPFMTVNVIGTIVTVILKGVLAGLCSGLAYQLVKRWNKYAAVIVAAIVCPVVNTGVFLVGCRLFFWPTITGWAEGLGFKSAATYAILRLAGVNFLLELAINIILAPAIARILGLSQDKDVAEMVYGIILSVFGAAALLYAMILLRKAYLGKIPAAWEIQNPGRRYAIMALMSNLVEICGVVLLVAGFSRKKVKKQMAEKPQKNSK